MNRTRINYAVVRHLILKDWYLNRWVILGSLPVGLGALALVLTGRVRPWDMGGHGGGS